MYVCVCVCLCLYVSVCVYVRACRAWVCVCVCVCVYVCRVAPKKCYKDNLGDCKRAFDLTCRSGNPWHIDRPVERSGTLRSPESRRSCWPALKRQQGKSATKEQTYLLPDQPAVPQRTQHLDRSVYGHFCVCVSICVCVCLSNPNPNIYIYMCVAVCPSVYAYVCVSFSMCVCVCVLGCV